MQSLLQCLLVTTWGMLAIVIVVVVDLSWPLLHTVAALQELSSGSATGKKKNESLLMPALLFLFLEEFAILVKLR